MEGKSGGRWVRQLLTPDRVEAPASIPLVERPPDPAPVRGTLVGLGAGEVTWYGGRLGRPAGPAVTTPWRVPPDRDAVRGGDPPPRSRPGPPP